MPMYVVKVTDPNGWISVPIVANCETEEEAADLVRCVSGTNDKVEVKGLRPDVMRAAFGNVPAGTAQFRIDWTWGGENDDVPEPY